MSTHVRKTHAVMTGEGQVWVRLRDPRITFTVAADDAVAVWHELGRVLQMEHSEGLRGELERDTAAALAGQLRDARGELAEEHELRKAAEDQAARDRAEVARISSYLCVARRQRDTVAVERDALRAELAEQRDARHLVTRTAGGLQGELAEVRHERDELAGKVERLREQLEEQAITILAVQDAVGVTGGEE